MCARPTCTTYRPGIHPVFFESIIVCWVYRETVTRAVTWETGVHRVQAVNAVSIATHDYAEYIEIFAHTAVRAKLKSRRIRGFIEYLSLSCAQCGKCIYFEFVSNCGIV